MRIRSRASDEAPVARILEVSEASDTSVSAVRHLVSVVVPVYNASAYLADTVSSILGQHYRDLEVILVDDGSTDGSGSLCDELAKRDERVVVIHRPNGGIAAAQNSGLDAATGSLITFCDNDDLLDPRAIGRLVQILDDAGADMSCCRWRNVGASVARRLLREHADDTVGDVEVFEDPATQYQRVFSLLHRRLRRRELRYFSEANWGKLYRAALWDGIRFPEGRYAQDVAVAMELYLRMSRVASCEDALYYWVQHRGSVSHASRNTTYFHDIVRAHGRSFDLALAAGIVPVRAYGGLRTIGLERRSVRSVGDAELYAQDRHFVERRVKKLSFAHYVLCVAVHAVRWSEVQVYRATVHRRR